MSPPSKKQETDFLKEGPPTYEKKIANDRVFDDIQKIEEKKDGQFKLVDD